MYKWKKIGLIFTYEQCPWASSHAQNPFPEYLHGDLFKIHFSARDNLNQAMGGWVVIDINHPSKIIDISPNPTITNGELGCFDDCGAMPSCIVNTQGKQWMYYTGWSKAVKTPFSFFIGLAISNDKGQSFSRYSKAPVIGRNYYDPLLTAAPWVLHEKNLWKMWYVSCMRWEKEPSNRIKHYYNIHYAESSNGIQWKTNGTVCIDFQDDEYAIARPVVIKESNLYKMWYCYRGGSSLYKPGYAESEDGIHWERKDHLVGIAPSRKGWDSEMLCYPCVFKHKNNYFMLYNGNGYGKTGFGLAVLEEG